MLFTSWTEWHQDGEGVNGPGDQLKMICKIQWRYHVAGPAVHTIDEEVPVFLNRQGFRPLEPL